MSRPARPRGWTGRRAGPGLPRGRAECFPLQALAMAPAVPGPDPEARLSDDYVRLVARDAYFWAWPIVNVYNRRVALGRLPHPMLLGGVLPAGPANSLTMLTDYVDPAGRAVACPNHDLVCGSGIVALDQSPVVLQVPDFGDRFWVVQVLDSRTDSIAELGRMYGSPPGFYLLVGPNWVGTVPPGIRRVFVSQTRTGVVIPRVFRDDSVPDLKTVQRLINQLGLYPVAQFDGRMKTTDWRQVPVVPAAAGGGDAETRWVAPETFLADLPAALADARPLPGESARYAQVLAVAAAAARDARLRQVFEQAVAAADRELVEPLFEFRSHGRRLPHHWSTIANGACFGTDYFTRTAVAKSNIFVNKPNEAQCFHQDFDRDGARLCGSGRYTVTFAQGAVPPVKGFWSMSLYNGRHLFEVNALGRYAVGSKSGMRFAADGSLTIHVQPQSPGAEHESNWLPAPAGDASEFSLSIRAYWPESAVLDGRWTPPAVVRCA
ncbi:DUF1254 domain-containing protein [Variovorax sp. J31P207]|uniref:DUF1254 domain-containing protein n=1 Tax=Variovorax sp. J31P207 TaxID=3053510 RepID=UPI002575BEF1|nr:DUF1254 domain-containing protein [Variovorax sp. J31P207]MDM0070444.1 DUF1214 domain-containing protein [Variovorax sp. J31P207]